MRPRRGTRREVLREEIGQGLDDLAWLAWGDWGLDDDDDDGECPSCGALVYGLGLASIGGCIVGEPHRYSALVAPWLWARYERTARYAFGLELEWGPQEEEGEAAILRSRRDPPRLVIIDEVGSPDWEAAGALLRARGGPRRGLSPRVAEDMAIGEAFVDGLVLGMSEKGGGHG